MCATGTLDRTWRTAAAANLEKLRDSTVAARKAADRLAALTRQARQVIDAVRVPAIDMATEALPDPGLAAGVMYWHQTSPAIARYGSGRVKLIMLRRRVPLDVARQATHAWATLSRATHHHRYEAQPSVSGLRRLHQIAAWVAGRISPP